MKEVITGVILAGGRGERMGGVDKGLVPLNGQPMIEHVIARLRHQVADIIISANRNHALYEQFGFRVVADALPGYLGPLAGIASGLHAATTDYVAIAPCDCPVIGDTLIERLWQALDTGGKDVAVAHDGARLQPTFLLLRRELLQDLNASLYAGERKIETWVQRHRAAVVSFENEQAFVNINDATERGVFEARR